MRKVSGAAVATIMAIALYFTLFWGSDALRMITSPTFGLEDVWRSQYVFGMGRVLGLTPMGMIQLAAFFATLKLAVAVICALHFIDRLRSGAASAEILEGGLILVALLAIASAAPAMWSHNVELVREQAIQLALAALAGALCLVERSYRTEAPEMPVVPQTTSFAPWR